jgi:hypothetical protein
MLTGLSQINIELTSSCNKSCYFCGHQNIRINTGLEYGDADFGLLESLAGQIPRGIIVQFHRDGEPTIYPRLEQALRLFCGHIRSIVTNGKNLVERAGAIVGHCESLTVSAFDNDPDGDEQLDQLRGFLKLKGERKPNVNVKIVGDMDADRLATLEALGVPILHRSIHHPGGDFKYKRSVPLIPEVGICLDFLSHPSVDWRGNFFVCNRLDVGNHGLIGSLCDSTLDSLWNGEKRKAMMAHHINGRRDLANPLCAKCEYWGIPTNG